MANSRFLLIKKYFYAFLFLVLAGFLVYISNIKRPPVAVAAAAQIHQQCEAKPQPSEIFDCYEASFEADMNANGARHTLTLLDDLKNLGGYAKTNCHPLSHKVGNIALHIYGSVPKAAPEYLPVCYSGYYHGLLEEYLGTAPSYETGIREVCGKAGDGYFNWFQCTHGLGHGVMQFRDNEVPKALQDCDLLDPGHSASEICYAGVFMENITTDEKTGHPAKFIKQDNPIYPCDAVDTKYKSACYFLASSQILKINGWNMPDAVKVCETKAEKDYRWLCFQSIGRDVSGSTLRDTNKVNELCMLPVAEFRGDCFFGAVRDFVNEKGQFDAGIVLCQAVPAAYTQKCFDGVFLDLTFLRRGQEFLAECAKMPEPYLTQCKQRAI